MNPKYSYKRHFLFHLGHPAHFQLFKNAIHQLIRKDHRITIVIKKKDILESLLKKEGLPYHNLLPEGRTNSKAGILRGMIKSDYQLLKHCLFDRPDLMIGTSYAISHVGKILSIPSINVNEDDWDAVPYYAKFSYPWSTVILTPTTCSTGKWEHKTIKYHGYHELAYLSPRIFKPDPIIVSQYVNLKSPYFIIRFSSFNAHHDKGIQGITGNNALKLVEFLCRYGDVHISSERELPKALEKYRLNINPLHIHHVMSFAKFYIGDSQTMAAESGVMGVPFIRINDFVGRLGYLNELERVYNLGIGLKSCEQDKMFEIIIEWLKEDIRPRWKTNHDRMLKDKINVSTFLVWIIENYPQSVKIMRENADYQFTFK